MTEAGSLVHLVVHTESAPAAVVVGMGRRP